MGIVAGACGPCGSRENHLATTDLWIVTDPGAKSLRSDRDSLDDASSQLRRCQLWPTATFTLGVELEVNWQKTNSVHATFRNGEGSHNGFECGTIFR